MSELFKAALAGAWVWVITYAFPAALTLGLGAVAISVLDPRSAVVKEVGDWGTGDRTAAAIGGTVLAAMLLAGLNSGLHRILEGYVLLPRFERLWNWLCARQLMRKQKLQSAVESASDAPLRAALLRERVHDYPDDNEEIGPTRYGNCVRALETYAVTRFTLDSQYLWGELTSCAPEPARTAESEARSFVDFLVNLLFLSGAMTIWALVYAVAEWDARWLLVAVGSAIGTFVWKRLTYAAVRSWRSAVRAVVDLGRAPLAEALRLSLPPSLDKERDMWRALVWALRDQHAESADQLRAFVSRQASS